MSNASFAIALNSLCRARSTQAFPIKQFLLEVGPTISLTRRLLCTESKAAVSRTIRPGFNDRILGRSVQQARLKSKSATKAVQSSATKRARSKGGDVASVPDGSLPASKLTEAPTEASHTEGVPAEEAWRDYDPEGGLPLPNGELSQAEIDEIFGPDAVDRDNGNYILCVMHWRRMSGSLIDIGITFPAGNDIAPGQALQALEYLRHILPDVDEQAMGARWAKEESEKLRQTLEKRALKLGLYKADIPQEEYEEEEEDDTKQGTAYGRARTGESMLERLRARNIAKREDEETLAQIRVAQKERSLLSAARGPLELAGGLQEQVGVKQYGTMDVVLQQPASSASLVQREPPAWVKYYQDHAEIIKENIVPQMSAFARLAPSALVCLLVISGAYYFGSHYTPPPLEARLFPGLPSSTTTIGALTIALVGMYVAGKVPQFWRTLNKYFLLVPAYPFAQSNIGAIFRHDTFSHLASNVAMLWLVGLPLHEDIGRGWFLATYFSAGVTGTMGALVFHVLARNWTIYIYGASGAVYGILSALCILRPQGKVYVFGYELPFAAWFVLGAVGITNVAGVVRTARRKALDNIDYLGHAFGLFSGAVAGLMLRARFKNDDRIAKPDKKAIVS